MRAIVFAVMLAGCGDDPEPFEVVRCRGMYTLNGVKIDLCEFVCRDVPPLNEMSRCGALYVVEVDGVYGTCGSDDTGMVIRWVPCE